MSQYRSHRSEILPDHTTQKIKTRDKSLTDVLSQLVANGIVVQQCSPHHLKYGSLNYYPRRGIIHRDGAEARFAVRGTDAFIKACFEEAGIDPDKPGTISIDI